MSETNAELIARLRGPIPALQGSRWAERQEAADALERAERDLGGVLVSGWTARDRLRYFQDRAEAAERQLAKAAANEAALREAARRCVGDHGPDVRYRTGCPLCALYDVLSHPASAAAKRYEAMEALVKRLREYSWTLPTTVVRDLAALDRSTAQEVKP